MEKEPTFESNESRKERIIRLFRDKGLDDPEAMRILKEWAIEREKQVGDSPEDSIAFDLERARLHLAAGRVRQALEHLEDASDYAYQMQMDELNERIRREIDAVASAVEEGEKI